MKKEGFNLGNLVFGERKEIITAEQLSAPRIRQISEDYSASIHRAYEAKTYARLAAESTDAVAKEALQTMRHWAAPFRNVKGPWREGTFWKRMSGVIRETVDQANSPFANAFIEENGAVMPRTDKDGKAAYEAAFDEPGPSEPNRAGLIKVQALLEGTDPDLLVSNRPLREAIAGRVEESLANIGLFALTDIVIEELEAAGVGGLDNVRTLRGLREEEVHERLKAAVPDGDYFKKKIVGQKETKIASKTYGKKNAAEALFLRTALALIHGTWEGASPYRAKTQGEDRVLPDARDGNNRPLPDYVRVQYGKLCAKGLSAEDAVLVLGYELYKDVRIARQEDRAPLNRVRVPDAWMFSKTNFSEGEAPAEEPAAPAPKPGKKARASNAVVLGAIAALGAAEPANVQQERITYEHVVGPKAQENQGGYAVVTAFLHKLEQDPTALAKFEELFPRNGQNAGDYMRGVSAELGFYDAARRESAVIHEGDHLEFSTDGAGRLTYVDKNGRTLSTPAKDDPRKFRLGELLDVASNQ